MIVEIVAIIAMLIFALAYLVLVWNVFSKTPPYPRARQLWEDHAQRSMRSMWSSTTITNHSPKDRE